MKTALKAMGKRGLIRRGSYMVEVLDARRLAAGAVPLSPVQIYLAAEALDAYVEKCCNQLLAARVAVEADTLRSYIGHAAQEKFQQQQGDPNMSVQRRNILGPAADLGPKANQVSGGDDSLSARQPYTAPSTLSDQTSPQTEEERGGLESAFKQSQQFSSQIGADGGAGGLQLGRGADTFTTEGHVEQGNGTAVVGATGGVVLRADGGDDPAASAYGKAIG